MSSKAPVRNTGTSTCVAIDLGATAVRVVEVEWSGDGVAARLTKRGFAPLPLNCWNNLETQREGVANAIREALSSAGIVTRAVVACLPRRFVTLRFAHLPPADPEQFHSMVTIEAQQYVPLAIEDVVLSYHRLNGPLEGDTEEMETVLLAAARRTLILDIMAIFDRVGVEVQRLSVSALALAEHARDALEPTALLDLEPGELDVAVVADGRLLFTRASVLDIEGAIPEVAERRLADEVARSFTSYQNEFRHKTITHIYLSGPSVTPGEAPRIESALSSILDMPVTRLQSRLLPATDADARTYATAAGMALQTQAGSLAPINLVPSERTELKAKQFRRLQRQAAVVGFVIVAAFALVFARNALASRAALEKKTLQANHDMTEAQNKVNALKKPHDQKVALASSLEKGLDRNHPSVDVLVALNRAMPKSADIWLTQMTFDRGGLITLRGETKSASAATDLVIALQASGAFVDVKLGYLGDAQENVTTETAQNTPPAAAPAAAETPNVNPLPGIPSGGPGNANPNPNPNRPGLNPGGMNPGGRFPGGVNGAMPSGFPGGIPGGAPGGVKIYTPDGGTGATPGLPPGFPPGGFTPPGGAPPTPLPPPPMLINENLDENSAAQVRFHRRQRTPTPGPGTAAIPRPGTATGRPANMPPAIKTVTTGGPASSNKAPANAGKAASGSGHTPLTSFIVTCRVNSRKATLVPADAPGPAIQPAAPSKHHGKPAEKSPSETDTPDDNGEPDAN